MVLPVWVARKSAPVDINAAPDGNSNVEKTWQLALEQCRRTLGEEDYELISAFESPDQLIEAVQNLEHRYNEGSVRWALKGIKSPLEHLKNFIVVLMVALGPPDFSMACLWGSVLLLIQMASQSEEAISKIAQLLNQLGQKLELFKIYNENIDIDVKIKQKLFDLLVELMLHTATAVRHFRKNDEITKAVQYSGWGKIQNRFSETLDNIAATIDHIQKLLEAQNTLQVNLQLRSPRPLAQVAGALTRVNFLDEATGTHDEDMLCNTVPFPPNPSFFGRSEIISEISETLKFNDSTSGIRSVALWGTGGIGKTQVALQFANLVAQGVHAVIWICSETEAEVSKYFNDAAAQLRLPDYKDTNTPAENRLIVLQWLQRTTKSWLMVFDNVEADATLRENWPVMGNGCILVTCRSENLATSRAAKTIEIPTFSIEESSALMLKILDRKDIDDDEKTASMTLCSRLGGLALALDLIAKQVRSRRKLIRDFIPYYDSNYSSMHKTPAKGFSNPYYEKDLTTVWKAAFENLTPNARACMSLLSFVSPEGVPSWLLGQDVELGARYFFLQDEMKFDDAKLELLDLSLLQINAKTGQISMHRLIQTAFFDQIDFDDRIAALKTVYMLLRKAYPDRTFANELYTRWPVCSQLWQHVLAWRDRHGPLYRNGFHELNEDATILIMDVVRYVAEIGSIKTCEEILTPVLRDYPNKTSPTYGYVCHEAGTLYDRTGRSVLALDVYQTAYNIDAEKYLENDPYCNAIATAYNRMNLALVGVWRGEESLKWVDKAIECMKQQNVSDKVLATKYNAARFWRNRGRSNFIIGHYQDSKNDFAQAIEYQHLMYGKDSHFDGETAYMLAKIYYKEKNWETALRYAQRAYDLMAPGKPNHATIIATRFLQATILIGRGQHTGTFDDDTEALHYLRDALTMCQINEAQRGDGGESARVKWRMAQIMSRKGHVAEAKAFLGAAQETKNTLVATGEYALPDDEEESWNALVGMLYR